MTNRFCISFVVGAATLCLLAACSKTAQPEKTVAPPASAVASAAASIKPAPIGSDRLVGQWTGPEGTFLHLAGVSGRYAITISNLDGQRNFTGRGEGGAIVFERDGKRESIRTTDGAGTGMKWLAQKKDCIVVQPGEGYCRD